MEGADFFVEGLLDLTNGGDDMMTDAYLDSVAGNSTDSPSLTPASDSGNSSSSGGNLFTYPDSSPFSSELCVPSDELEELEWLSNFVEESFSTEELHKYQYQFNPALAVQGQFQTRQSDMNLTTNGQPTPVPGKARSKRSRVAPCDWSTRLLMVSNANPSPATSSSSSEQNPGFGPKKATKKRESGNNNENLNGEVRRCLHCAAEKTPQWRTGPMGPKTLCNACGVRYKSGRLVPEYRPAASPTFISTKHSNSHRKVMELRRQKDVQRHHPQLFMGHHHHSSMLMGVSNGGDNYLIPHQMGHDYRQMI